MAKKVTKTATLQTPYNFNDKWEELLENKEFINVFLSDVLENYIITTAVGLWIYSSSLARM